MVCTNMYVSMLLLNAFRRMTHVTVRLSFVTLTFWVSSFMYTVQVTEYLTVAQHNLRISLRLNLFCSLSDLVLTYSDT